jgi:hypothetical protein
MRILLAVSAYNGLCQRAHIELDSPLRSSRFQRATYSVDCFRDGHLEGHFPVREDNYQTSSLDVALEVADARVKSDKYDRVEVVAMGDSHEVSTSIILFCWKRDKAAQA